MMMSWIAADVMPGWPSKRYFVLVIVVAEEWIVPSCLNCYLQLWPIPVTVGLIAGFFDEVTHVLFPSRNRKIAYF